MNSKRQDRKVAKKIILPIMLVSIMTSAAVMAKPFWAERGSHMEHKFEHMIEKLDLNDDQERQAELILEDLKQQKGEKGSHKEMRSLIMLNPEDSDYLSKVDEHANQAAEKVKSKIVQMAKAKQALYGILDEAQKTKMSKMMERRLKKFDKKMKERIEE